MMEAAMDMDQLSAQAAKDGYEEPRVMRHRRGNEESSFAAIDVRKAVTIFVLIICACVLVGISLSGVMQVNEASGFLQCAHIRANADRLACYDKMATRAETPFKGASPFATYSRSDFWKSS
ncbi:MAG: hypothetical protein QM780_03835 [Hyphomicrobium sp.]|uniref:hypothetical protein n=1 Tax=Hyphomicrobium sp. TaxID=82 RepID=UPI0039E25092